MNDHDERLKQKKWLFDAFESSSEDEAPDTGRIEAQAVWKSLSFSKQPATPALTGARPLARSASDGRLGVRDPASKATSDPPSSTEPQIQAKNLKGGAMSKAPSILRKTVSDVVRPKSSPQNNRKRKRGERAEPFVPIEKQVFKGLQFYFFPNDDKNPARRKKIEKAKEYGAVWQKSWSPSITHVVMDKGLSYQQLLKYLKLDGLPEGITVVCEDYTSSSITYGTLLDPKQVQFSVKGLDRSENAHIESIESDTSLQLKPPKKGVLTKQQQQTPPQQPPQDVQVAATVRNEVALAQAAGAADVERIPNSFNAPTSNDELDAVIEEAKALRDVPLDDEDDMRPGTSESLDSDDEQQKPGLKQKSKYQRMENRFSCMQKHTVEGRGVANAATIDILQQMADYYGQTGDEWRIRAYRKAISSLRNHPTKVTTKEEALALPNVGDRLATKIEEIAFTKHLRRLDNAKAEPVDQLVQTFMQVYGAGIVQANRWVNEGYTSLDELLQKADLTANQRIGIEHYEDFNSRISRAEVAQHGGVVRDALQKIDSTFEVIIGGSYRRGAQDSGDIDCLVTRPDGNADHLRNVVLGQLIPQLTAQGFLVAGLATTAKDDGSKWHGASRLPGSKVWRRIDLLLVPSDELGAALIYWTGNDIFCRSLRLLASTKGMRLNQRGLYKEVMRGPQRVKLTEGTLVEGKDEKKIFEALGVKWRPPEHRIC